MNFGAEKKSGKYAFPIRIEFETLHSMNMSVVTLNDTQKAVQKCPLLSDFFLSTSDEAYAVAL